MSALSIQPTYPIFTETDGQPLEDGYIWIGTANLDPQTNPINVYWDAALTQLAGQPIRTEGGYPVNSGTPARLYVNSDYSIRVMNKKGGTVYSAPAATERYSDVVVSGVNAEDVIYDPPFLGGVQTNVEAKLAQAVSVKDFGAVGDGSDESTVLQSALAYANGRTLDFNGLTLTFDSAIEQAFTSDTWLVNGGVKYNGSVAEYALKLLPQAGLSIRDFSVDANTKAAKSLWVIASSSSVDCYMENVTSINAEQDASTGLAAAIHCTADTGCKYTAIRLIDCTVADVVSTGGSNVGRGVLVQDFDYCLIDGADIRRVGPYQDGDGIYASSPLSVDGVLGIYNSYFEDCQKRSIKSQIAKTFVGNVTSRRTQAFTVASGQGEFALQSGGTLNGAECFYADGAAPNKILSGTNTGLGVSFRNVSIVCDDVTDVINTVVYFSNNTSNAYDGFVAENIHTNSLAQNILYLYSDTGAASSGTRLFDSVYIRNIVTAGFNAEAETAVAFITRGASAYVKAYIQMTDCSFGTNNTVALAYLDPTPGSTSYLDVDFTRIVNVIGCSVNVNENLDAVQRIYCKNVNLAENAVGSLTVPMLTAYPGAKVKAFYVSSRDTSASKLYTEGYWFYGSSTSYYVETLAGNKTQAGQGTLSISASSTNIVVDKTAGSNSSNGRLYVIVEHFNSVDV